jgi:Na+/glutamate symporter
MPPVSVEEVGLSLVVLSLVFACAALIRRWSSPLRKLFIPTAVIGGFLVLGLGPEGMGRLLGGTGLFPENVFAVWRQLPALLVTVMSTSLLLGEHLPHSRKLWSISGSHVIMISVMSFGQFAVGGILVWLLLEPVFGINRKAGALLEMSFNGGHGTVAGLTPVLQQYGVGDLAPVGLGLATIGIVSGIVVGTTLVNYAIRSPSIPVVRQTPPSPDEDFDIDHHLPGPDDRPMDEWKGMAQVTAATVFLGVTIALAIALLALFRAVFHLAGSDFFDRFPLFPFTFPAAVIVQLCARRVRFRVGRQSSGGRRARGNRDRRCHHLRGWHIVVGSDRGEHRPADHHGGCSDWLERLRDTGHRAAHLPAALVRTLHSRVRRIPGHARLRLRDAGHGRPVAANGRRQRLQLSADHHASHPRRWLHDGARRSVDQSHWVASLHDRGCGGYRGIDRLGIKAGRPRRSKRC